MKKCKLNVISFALSGGLVWVSGILILSLINNFFSLGGVFINMISGIYKGFDTTVLGTLIGMLYGFFDMGIASLIFAGLYNFFTDKLVK